MLNYTRFLLDAECLLFLILSLRCSAFFIVFKSYIAFSNLNINSLNQSFLQTEPILFYQQLNPSYFNLNKGYWNTTDTIYYDRKKLIASMIDRTEQSAISISFNFFRFTFHTDHHIDFASLYLISFFIYFHFLFINRTNERTYQICIWWSEQAS